MKLRPLLHLALLACMICLPCHADTQVQRLTWAGVHLHNDRTSVLVDAVLTDIWGGSAPGGLVLPDTGERRVFALITHAHNDHFDAAGLHQVLGERGYVICAESIATYIASRGFRVIPAPPYQPILRGGFVFTAVPAADGFGDDQVSWVISDGEHRYFHAGDTLWHGGMTAIGLQHGPFDVAFLPINGARFIQDPPIHTAAVMSPDQALDAANALRAQMLVPIHFGFEDPPNMIEHPEALQTLLAGGKARGILVRHLRPGEWVE